MIFGLALCTIIGAAAWLLQQLEVRLAGSPYIEALVLAIVLGSVIRTFLLDERRIREAGPGISFAAKPVLEFAVFLLGASVDFREVGRGGPILVGGIVAIVGASLAISYATGRAMGLGHRLSTLVACGNSICGNSAIAAVAPVIGADPEEVASAIGFTAALGVVVVLLLPLLLIKPSLTTYQYGVVSGMTVYAVPQVIAATFGAGPVASSTGTLVKLIRVLLLGPVVFVTAILNHRSTGRRLTIGTMLPWFIAGFAVLAALRTMGIITPTVGASLRQVVAILTTISMAALGLGVDLHALRRVGARVSIAVSVSLVMLFGMSLTLARFLATSSLH